jgi:hypothetical protein
MNTTKTLMLAAAAALSLGMGTAMADGDAPMNDYQAWKILQARQAQSGQVQSGSSDADSARGWWQQGPFHATPDRLYPVAGDQGRH